MGVSAWGLSWPPQAREGAPVTHRATHPTEGCPSARHSWHWGHWSQSHGMALMAWHCMAQHGTAQHSLAPMAWLCMAQPGTAQHSTGQPGTDGLAPHGSAWHSTGQPGTAWHGLAQLPDTMRPVPTGLCPASPLPVPSLSPCVLSHLTRHRARLPRAQAPQGGTPRASLVPMACASSPQPALVPPGTAGSP